MSLDVARAVAWLLEGYAVAGLLFAAVFLRRGIVRVDPIVGHSPWTVRLLLAPGVVALWPLVAMIWRRTATPAADAGAEPAS
ncbi:MAG: hypothetical protein ABIT71_21645 [Vicinamibacteraceae bacterium]